MRPASRELSSLFASLMIVATVTKTAFKSDLEDKIDNSLSEVANHLSIITKNGGISHPEFMHPAGHSDLFKQFNSWILLT